VRHAVQRCHATPPEAYLIMAQLSLALEDLRKAVPWGGQSPRDLTKGAQRLFLRREPQKDDCFFVDVRQYDLFLAAIPGRTRYGGAPLLHPFEQEGI